MGRLSTHVLDVSAGRPAAGVRIKLFRLDGTARDKVTLLAEVTTNADGRTDAPLLAGDALVEGSYELLFHIGDYFAVRGAADAKKFLDVVPVAFAVADASANYHVPLVASPWSYSTYRGS